MERLSALMDGELDDREVVHELASIKADPEREAVWKVYHMIGDTLRGEEVYSSEVAAQVGARLDDEPTVLAPRMWKMGHATRRVALPIAASLCGAAVVAWLALSNNVLIPTEDAPGEVAVIAEAPEAVMDAGQSEADGMSEYLMAHQQFSPSTAMQGVVPYVRTVSAVDGSR